MNGDHRQTLEISQVATVTAVAVETVGISGHRLQFPNGIVNLSLKIVLTQQTVYGQNFFTS